MARTQPFSASLATWDPRGVPYLMRLTTAGWTGVKAGNYLTESNGYKQVVHRAQLEFIFICSLNSSSKKCPLSSFQSCYVFLSPPISTYLSWPQFCGQAGDCTLLSVEKKIPTNPKRFWKVDLTLVPGHLAWHLPNTYCTPAAEAGKSYVLWRLPLVVFRVLHARERWDQNILYTEGDRKGQTYLPESFRICLDFFFYTQKCTATSLPTELRPR
jgi:hypothetical protein